MSLHSKVVKYDEKLLMKSRPASLFGIESETISNPTKYEGSDAMPT